MMAVIHCAWGNVNSCSQWLKIQYLLFVITVLTNVIEDFRVKVKSTTTAVVFFGHGLAGC